jgi:cytochrome c oxidase subunit 2
VPEQFELLPGQASTAAERVDALFLFILGVTVFFLLLIAGLVIGFCIKYRRRSAFAGHAQVGESLGLELTWTIIPLVISLVMFVWGSSVFVFVRRPPEDAEQVFIVAKQWMWKVQHLDGQREINELHLPVGRPVRLQMISEDVIHDFFVPAFRTKMDVLPGRYSSMWVVPTKPGTFRFFCSQYCGTNHSRMIGQVVVMEPTRFQAWLSGRSEGSAALEGRKLFLKLRCITCHSAGAQARAPLLEELAGRPVSLRDGRTVIAEDGYLRESILNPRAKIVAGFEPIMPTYQGQVTEEELLQLIAFIQSLERGQTPVRTEESAPPIVEQDDSESQGLQP